MGRPIAVLSVFLVVLIVVAVLFLFPRQRGGAPAVVRRTPVAAATPSRAHVQASAPRPKSPRKGPVRLARHKQKTRGGPVGSRRVASRAPVLVPVPNAERPTFVTVGPVGNLLATDPLPPLEPQELVTAYVELPTTRGAQASSDVPLQEGTEPPVSEPVIVVHPDVPALPVLSFVPPVADSGVPVLSAPLVVTPWPRPSLPERPPIVGAPGDGPGKGGDPAGANPEEGDPDGGNPGGEDPGGEEPPAVPVPEPRSLLLLATGLTVLGALRRKRRG